MAFTIASLLNTPEGSTLLGTKRRTGTISPETNDSPNKKRRFYASPGCVLVKVEVTPGPASPYCERLTYTYLGWCYWLPPPGEPIPLYEPVLVDNNANTEIDPSPRYVPPSPLDLIARSLVESFIAWQQVIALFEPETKTQAEMDATTANPILQIFPVSTQEEVSPRYVPPSPVEVITRYLLESFATWRPEGKYAIS
ncbi:hypothetical protein RhiLY_08977 [Ceratobasidium sp. AG-Ba]|nr:hypothetical protein RhiLY_08977 [Ceratobasidium sp. AG-Ba]